MSGRNCYKILFIDLVIRDFLPRGSGIVTRRPLILQLINAKAGDLHDLDDDTLGTSNVNSGNGNIEGLNILSDMFQVDTTY